MRIYNSTNNYYPSYKGFTSVTIKNVTRKTKVVLHKIDKNAGFMKTPMKYYAIGLAIPIPFASTVGLIIGLCVASYEKICGKHTNNEAS